MLARVFRVSVTSIFSFNLWVFVKIKWAKNNLTRLKLLHFTKHARLSVHSKSDFSKSTGSKITNKLKYAKFQSWNFQSWNFDPHGHWSTILVRCVFSFVFYWLSLKVGVQNMFYFSKLQPYNNFRQIFDFINKNFYDFCSTKKIKISTLILISIICVKIKSSVRIIFNMLSIQR